EFGVGLIPGGGGTKEFALRASDEYDERQIEQNVLKERFLTIGQAKVSTSAQEALELGYLQSGRFGITMNRDRLIADAKKKALELWEQGYTQPVRRKDIKVLGKQGLGIVYAGANSMRAGNYISAYDQLISEKLGWVLCGGDLSSPTEVSEQYLLDLERTKFLSLVNQKKTLKKLENMEAYIVAGFRTAVGKAPRGVFRFTRADDLAVDVVKHLVATVPNLDPEEIDDVIVGNATPEAEQGLNIGRMISLMGLNTEKVPGVTINRYCSSGLETIATAVAKIKTGMADIIIAGGVEVMSGMPFGGWKLVPNPEVAKEHPDWYWGMGLTAEAVAREFKISREDQDKFALHSHEKALDAIENGRFTAEIVPVTIKENYLQD